MVPDVPVQASGSLPSNDPRGRLLDGRYRIGHRIARGGMAGVYEAHDIRLDRTVAVKIMHAGLGDGDSNDFAERFVREARAAARLSHPNVVAVYDQGDDDGTVFLVMELIPGHTLRDTVTKESPMTPSRALALLEPVVSALASAHRSGLIHRDVKPENVLIADDGRVKVADFGLAKAISAETQHTATQGVLIGTVSYLAPELVIDGRADARADVYAVGRGALRAAHRRQAPRGRDPDPGRLQARPPRRAPAVRAGARAAGVRRCARRPRDGSRPHPPPGRRRSPAAPGAPGGQRPGQRRAGRPRADRGPPPAPRPVRRLPRPRHRHGPRAVGRRGDGGAAQLDGHPVGSSARAHDDVPRRQPAASPAEDPARSPAASDAAKPTKSAKAPKIRRTRTTRSGRELRTTRQRRSRRGLAVVLAALLVAGAIGGGAFWYGWARYVAAPQVLGEDRATAVATLEAVGLEVAFAEPAYDSDAPEGAVLRADPGGGAQVLPGDTVTLTLSLGKLLVPKVRGLDEDAAQDALMAVQLEFGESQERFHESQPAGTVLKSVPEQGTELGTGDTVDLVVSKGRRPIEVGSWVGKDVDTARAKIEKRGLTATVSTVYDDAPVGEVLTQSPTEGTLNKGDVVSLTVSKGPELRGGARRRALRRERRRPRSGGRRLHDRDRAQQLLRRPGVRGPDRPRPRAPWPPRAAL